MAKSKESEVLTSLSAFLILGLVGSFHCAGMCGGFAAAVAMASGTTRRRLLLDQAVFAFGKALTYVVLGLALRTILHDSVHASGIALLQRGLSVFAGAVLVLGGFKLMGLIPSLGTNRLTRTLIATFSRAQSAARALGGTAGAFGAGLLTGFLPCGLSWSAFALATQVRPGVAIIGLFLFGLGTSPALALTALGARRVLGWSPKHRIIGARVAGALLILFGLMTAMRGGWTVEEALAGELAPCCAQD
ncbi:MAG: sulfite exporter TauE/SafE [Gammaproteobacteria bacterium]|jgi:sulfite exporter TauE/SafE